MVPQIDMKGAAAAERQRTARATLEHHMANSRSTQRKQLAPPVGGLTARDAMTQRQQLAAECTVWATQLQQAVQDGIDSGVPDALLESGVRRILELEQQAEEQRAAAQAVAEARAALRATPVGVPTTRVGSAAAKRAAAAARCPLGEGSLVQLKGLEEVLGLSAGCFDVNLAEYNGRKGRVSKEPPPWVIKAVPVGAAARRRGGGVDAAARGTAARGTADSGRGGGGGAGHGGRAPETGVAALTASNLASLRSELSDRAADMLAPDVSDGDGGGEPAPLSTSVSAEAAAGAAAGAAAAPIEGLELVPVLLDARHTDKDPHRGLWIAVPACNIKVLQ